MSCSNHAVHSSSALVLRPRLYTQWAAMPNSASRCIWRVRIWISKGFPSGPMTVVWRARYRLSLGMAM